MKYNKNFEFEHEGNKYWYSRSCAVVGILLFHDLNWQWHVLANKRGVNTPDFQCSWCLPCGYVDFNETCEQALKRETFEETGYKINENTLSKIKLIGIDSAPENRQNITIRYLYTNHLDVIENIKLTNKNSDTGEVDEVKFIRHDEYKNYEWAFGHDKLIKQYLSW